MEYLAKDLQPGKRYAFQIRSTSGEDVSEWSPMFIVTTLSDSVSPGNVASISGSIIGSSFKLSWANVTQNADGSVFKDFKDYQITIDNGTTFVQRYTTVNSFLYTIEMNAEDFGTPVAALNFAVQARDITNNVSPLPATISLTNPPPGNVSGISSTAYADSIHVAWTAVADTDIVAYNVYADTTFGFTPSSGNLVFTAKMLNFNFPAVAGTIMYFQVFAMDAFGQESSIAAATNVAALPQKDHDTHAFTYTGTVATLTGSQRLYFDSPYTVVSCRASVGTAPTGADLKVDVKKNGTTLWNVTPANKPVITASTFTSGTVTNMDTVALAAGDFLTVDVTQIGSTVAGADLVVTVRVSAN